jgi:hypothetical protein
MHSFGPWMQADRSPLASSVMRKATSELQDSLFAPVDARFVALMLSSPERMTETLSALHGSQVLHRQLISAVVSATDVPLLRVQRREAIADSARFGIFLRELLLEEQKRGPLTISDDFIATLKGVATPASQELLVRAHPASFTSDMLSAVDVQDVRGGSGGTLFQSVHDR